MLKARFWSAVRLSPVQSSPLHSTDVRSSTFSGFCASSVPSSLISIHSLPAKYIWSSIAQVHISQLQSKLVQWSAVQRSVIRNSSAQSRPVPFSQGQLTAVESTTTQSCSVKLGTTKCIAARPVKWSAIRKSPHWSPYKCISVQSCLQLTHQHNQERLLTALS